VITIDMDWSVNSAFLARMESLHLAQESVLEQVRGSLLRYILSSRRKATTQRTYWLNGRISFIAQPH
jgi:hypothetical protein